MVRPELFNQRMNMFLEVILNLQTNQSWVYISEDIALTLILLLKGQLEEDDSDSENTV